MRLKPILDRYYAYDLPDTGMSVYTGEDGGDVLLVADKCNNRVRKALALLLYEFRTCL